MNTAIINYIWNISSDSNVHWRRVTLRCISFTTISHSWWSTERLRTRALLGLWALRSNHAGVHYSNLTVQVLYEFPAWHTFSLPWCSYHTFAYCCSVYHGSGVELNGKATRLKTCDQQTGLVFGQSDGPQKVQVNKEIIFTYDVNFEVVSALLLTEFVCL